MFEDILGNTPQLKVLDFFFSSPFGYYTKSQIASASGVSQDEMDTFLDTFVDNEILIAQNSMFSLNTDFVFVQNLYDAHLEFIKFYFEKHLKDDDDSALEVETTNELDSTCGISDEELTERFKASIRIDQEICQIKGLPVAGYDDELNCPYIEYPDGRRVYPDE